MRLDDEPSIGTKILFRNGCSAIPFNPLKLMINSLIKLHIPHKVRVRKVLTIKISTHILGGEAFWM
jgi:hypothetical protein